MKWEVQRRRVLYSISIFHTALPSLFLSPGSHAPNLIFISCMRSGIFCIKDLYKLGKSYNVKEIDAVGTIFLSKRFDRAEAEKWAVGRQVNRRRL
jgi:hypothetical protein